MTLETEVLYRVEHRENNDRPFRKWRDWRTEETARGYLSMKRAQSPEYQWRLVKIVRQVLDP